MNMTSPMTKEKPLAEAESFPSADKLLRPISAHGEACSVSGDEVLDSKVILKVITPSITFSDSSGFFSSVFGNRRLSKKQTSQLGLQIDLAKKEDQLFIEGKLFRFFLFL
jgi:hypothetical protein